MFTARNRQNAFAKRRREQKAAEAETAAIIADPDTMEAIAEAEAERTPVAVPVDLNPDSAEYTQTPDISTYATGGFTGQAVIGPPSPYPYEPVSEEPKAADELSQLGQDIEAEMSTPQHIAIPVFTPELQAKIEAVANRAIPPAADERPDYPGPRGAEIMRKPVDAPTTSDELIASITDPGPAPVVEPETPQEDEPKRGRGRPRPQETIDRDNAVHALLVGADAETGISKESIAAELNEKEQQVYSSLRQLSKEGRAATRYVKPHGYRWFTA